MILQDKLRNHALILASNSPRRRELIEGCGLPFRLAQKFECEELYPANTPAEQVPLYLSRLKSEAYPEPLAAGEILLTADTVVILDGRVLGKPDGRDGAIQMLRELSGRDHTVVTGVTLRSHDRSRTFEAHSRVWFRALTDQEIVFYVDNYHPYDKAGSYGIQEWIGYAAIERIEGSFYNVMGLPIQKVYTELNTFID